jgi:hypothetical protein
MHFALRFRQLDGGINSSYMLTDQRIAFPSCASLHRQSEFKWAMQRCRTYDWLPDFLALPESKSFMTPNVH